MKALKAFRDRALNPENPVYQEAQLKILIFSSRQKKLQTNFMMNVPEIVADYMNEINKITGRDYKPFDYYGAQRC